MTQPDWTPVATQPAGYITAEDAAQIRAGTIDVCAMSMQRGDATDVAMFAAPVPQQQPGQPQEYMRGYSEAKQWAMDVLESAKQKYSVLESVLARWALEDVLETLRQNEARR